MATKKNRALLAHEKKSAERRRKRSLPIKADEAIGDVTGAPDDSLAKEAMEREFREWYADNDHFLSAGLPGDLFDLRLRLNAAFANSDRSCDVTPAVAASDPDRLDEMDRKLDILIEIVGRFGRDANAHAAAAARLNMALKTMIYSLTTDAERQADK